MRPEFDRTIDPELVEAFRDNLEKQKKLFGMRLIFSLMVLLEIIVSIALVTVLLFLFQKEIQLESGKVTILIILLVSIVVGVSISVFLGMAYNRPITRLRDAMKKVAEGDYTVRMPMETKFSEVNELYSSFNVMTQELQSTEILKTDFISGVSHEIKTPIGAIEGYAMLLQTPGQSNEEREQCVDRILYNTERLTKLVGNMLLLSKLENSTITHQSTTFRLDEQIRQMFLSQEPGWSKKEIDFDIEMDEVEYTGDEVTLSQVWSNLLSNAVKFVPEKNGFIGIYLKNDLRNRRVTFIIEDNGPGINEEAKKHIFDKFYQADTSHKAEGNGLGLSLVKQIVGMAEGTIQVENRAEGGARFTVCLPIK